MTTTPFVLEDGKPLTIAVGDEAGKGPWSRLLASSIVPEPRSARGQRGRELAEEGAVHTVAVATGHLTAKVAGSSGFDYDVELHARPLPPRVWSAVVGSGREFAAAAAGREQSVRLEHELASGWGEPLIPQSRSIRRSCTCPDIDFSGTCKHVVALAYVFAAAVDNDPELLLRWRGIAQAEQPAAEPTATPDPVAAQVVEADDPWIGGEVPVIEPPRPLPVGAVLKRLGPSGVKLDGVELIELLEPAYAALARPRTLTRVNTAGYSGTPLPKKLGIVEGSRIAIIDDPGHANALLSPLPAGVTQATKPARADVVVFFTTARKTFERRLATLGRAVHPDRSLWIAWPKKSSGVATDMTEDVIREVALPLGLVDNKVCAIDETWSGLRLVWRRELRG